MERLSLSSMMQESLIGRCNSTGSEEVMMAMGPDKMWDVSFMVMEAMEFKEGASSANVTPSASVMP